MVLDMGVSKNTGGPKMDGFILENPIKMDDLEVPQFSETSTWTYMGSLAMLVIWRVRQVISHLAVQRCLYAYFTGAPMEEQNCSAPASM